MIFVFRLNEMLQTRQWHILNVFCFTDKQTYRFLPSDICVAKTLQEIQHCCFFFFSVTSEVWKMNPTYQESGSVVQYAL